MPRSCNATPEYSRSPCWQRRAPIPNHHSNAPASFVGVDLSAPPYSRGRSCTMSVRQKRFRCSGAFGRNGRRSRRRAGRLWPSAGGSAGRGRRRGASPPCCPPSGPGQGRTTACRGCRRCQDPLRRDDRLGRVSRYCPCTDARQAGNRGGRVVKGARIQRIGAPQRARCPDRHGRPPQRALARLGRRRRPRARRRGIAQPRLGLPILLGRDGIFDRPGVCLDHARMTFQIGRAGGWT